VRALIRLAVPAVLAVLALASPAFAHAGHDHADAPGWTWDPWITGPLLLSGLLFAIGWWRLYARSGNGRARLVRRAWLFALGWLGMAGALVTPLHEAGERSFTAHMVEHELLMLVAAPLIVLAKPLSAMLWAFPPAGRRAIGGLSSSRPVSAVFAALTGAITSTVLQAAVMWIWHMPALFDLALASEGWHATQHLCFVVSALLFWTAMLGRRGAEAGMAGARVLAALCLLATSLITGALGALMAFSQSPWYAGYARLARAPFGLTPAEDQQIAGLIMWVPGGLVHAVAALLLFRTVLAPRRAAYAP
jgi:cytochrome c oxidase assembly factor CtaG